MAVAPDLAAGETFRHEAVFYDDLDAMVDLVLPFVTEGLERDEPVLVAQLPDRIARLVKALGPDAAKVRFLDMAEVGLNPARIIPEWRRFVDEHRSQGAVRGVGEPVWAGRRSDEIAECRLHEALLNVAFDDGPGWRLICPYDVTALPDEVIEGARSTHPTVSPASAGEQRRAGYAGHVGAMQQFTGVLPAPPAHAERLRFGELDLVGLRDVVRRLCDREQIGPDAVEDLVLAVHELAANSILHGGGNGVFRAWQTAESLVLEISDAGVIEDPLVGRELDGALSEHGRGVWIANQLCDLVQVRSSACGTVVRLHSWR